MAYSQKLVFTATVHAECILIVYKNEALKHMAEIQIKCHVEIFQGCLFKYDNKTFFCINQ